MIKYISKLSLFFLILVQTACQTEKHEVLTEEGDIQAADLEFSQLIERMAMYDGTQDDSIDDSPCFSVRFPYEVVIHGIEIKIASVSDLHKITNRLQGLPVDVFSLKFPLVITMPDYEVLSVENASEFKRLKELCASGKLGVSPINCALPEFPLKVLIYNSRSEKLSSFQIINKQQLYVFLQNKSPHELLDFEYPLELTLSGNSAITIKNKETFKEVLNNCNN